MDDKKIYDLLITINKTPGLYLGRKSLERLSFFIHGYIFRQTEIDEEYECLMLKNFQKFVENHYNINTHHWSQIIAFYSSSDEKAFDRFYELLNRFCAEEN